MQAALPPWTQPAGSVPVPLRAAGLAAALRLAGMSPAAAQLWAGRLGAAHHGHAHPLTAEDVDAAWRALQRDTDRYLHRRGPPTRP